MAEKLDPGIKNVLTALLPEGWSYYYAKSFLIIYNLLPPLELIRKIVNFNANESEYEISQNNTKYLCVYLSRNFLHWQGNGNNILYSKSLIKGNETILILSSANYPSSVEILFQLKKKLG